MKDVNGSRLRDGIARRFYRGLCARTSSRRVLWRSAVAVLVLAVVGCTSADRPNPEDLVFDFGFARQGDAVSHVFHVANPTSIPRLITRVATTCNCTVANLREGSSIPPTGVLDVPVEVDLSGKTGIVSSSVTLFFEGEEEPTRLLIKGQVPYEYPAVVDFGRVLRGSKNCTQSLRMATYPGQPPIDIVKVRRKDPGLAYAYHRVSDDPDVLILELTVTDKMDYGRFDFPVVWVTNDSGAPDKQMQITGFVVPPVEVLPKEINFGFVRTDNDLSPHEIVFSSTYGTAIAYLKIEATRDDCFDWSISSADSHSAKIQVKLREELPSELPAGIVKGDLRVHCELEGQEHEARVELYAVIPETTNELK
ncbi:MAG: DUF1573 domain-containing protein [Candidatus Hydrogenedentes bacterium]|nr:DUF1573 domain-containing protein [Candidatus Hydrogenedentota bacterium]